MDAFEVKLKYPPAGELTNAMLYDIQGDAFQEEVLEREGAALVLFWATWCPFCRRFKGLFDDAAANTDDALIGVDISDESSPLWDEYRVDVVPTLVLFRDGREVARRDGAPGVGLPRGSLEDLLAQA